MAPVATQTQSHTQAHAHHKKRAPPPGILTGLNSSTSSPSPSMATKRLPPSTSHSSASASVNANALRSATRPRRDGSNQFPSRGQRYNSHRSASIAVENPTWMDIPYVKDDAYILKKFRGHRPSLILHLFPTTFRFDNQHGSFSYKSPMKFIIEHLQSQTIPHDLMLSLLQAGVMFFDGCLIVQIEDHKSMTPKADCPSAPSSTEKSKLSTIHNWNHSVTVSPYIPFPPEAAETPSRAALLANGRSDHAKTKIGSEKDKENMLAPANPSDKNSKKQPKIFTTVLYPTPQTEEIRRAYEFAWLKAGGARQESAGQHTANTPLSAVGVHPPTPMTGVPATPRSATEPAAKRIKRDKGDASQLDWHEFDATVTLANAEPLYLEPAESAADMIALLEKMSHPRHAAKLPSSSPRKRTIAQMAADEAAAAQTERIMLWNDDRLSSNVLDGVANTGIEGQTVSDYRFSQLKVIETLRAQQLEKKKAEKEAQHKEATKKATQEMENRAKQAELHKREVEEKNRAILQQRQQQQEAQRRVQNAREQAIQNGHQMNQGQHGHPHANANLQNGAMQGPQQPQRFHPQQVSQAPQASPILRNGTPHNISSPMVQNGSGIGITPMQHTTSSMGGSPPRPGSAAQQAHPMGMGHAMSAQRSQQSHAGTPRMPNATPNLSNAAPINRQLNATPRMSQANPLPGNMATHMGSQMVMQNGVPMSQQQIQQLMQVQHQQQQQQQQQQALLQQQQHAMGMNPDLARMQMFRQQQLVQAVQQSQGQVQQNRMTPQQRQQLSERQYAQQVMMMQQNQMHGGMNGAFLNGPGMGNAHMLANGAMPMQQGLGGGGGGGGPQPSQAQVMMQQRMHQMTTANFQRGMQQLQATHGPNPPKELVEQLKAQASAQARQMRQNFMQRQIQAQAQQVALQQQQQHQQQQQQQQQQQGMHPGMPQNMMGQQQQQVNMGMGMGRGGMS